MEGFGEEVILFGVGTIVSGCLLVKLLLWNAGKGSRSVSSTTDL